MKIKEVSTTREGGLKVVWECVNERGDVEKRTLANGPRPHDALVAAMQALVAPCVEFLAFGDNPTMTDGSMLVKATFSDDADFYSATVQLETAIPDALKGAAVKLPKLWNAKRPGKQDDTMTDGISKAVSSLRHEAGEYVRTCGAGVVTSVGE